MPPLRRDRPVMFHMPAIETAADPGEATGAILQAAADGELTPDEATSIASLIEFRRRTIATLWSEAPTPALERSRVTRDEGNRPTRSELPFWSSLS
jgi:hypothetical protein